MKITFPHMGNIYIPLKVLFDTLGIDYVIPSRCNKKTLENGIAHSPEFACLPFKITLGDFIHGIEKGADFILMGGGCGQCRFGYYADLHSEILKSIGYKVEFVRCDTSNMTFEELVKKFKPLTQGKSLLNVSRAVIYAIRTVLMVDKLCNLSNYIRCREMNKGETDKVMKAFYNKVQKVQGYSGIKELIAFTKKGLKKIQVNKKFKPLKIAIVGEIYAAIEPYMNLDIERKLGNMGVEVHNKLSISHWVTEHSIKRLLPLKMRDKSHKAGKEFIKTDDVGGHGLETVGNSVICAQKGFDGIIHLYPFTCMPEIIAQSTFGELQEKYGISIMTLILDEMTGEAGYATRIEAFIDMLERKRQAKYIYNWQKLQSENIR